MPKNPADKRITRRALLHSAGPLLLGAPAVAPRKYRCHTVKAFPHDPTAFTEGLIFEGGRFYESTGLEGVSTIRTVDFSTGKTLKQTRLAPQHFAEGITMLRGELFQLTWNSGVVFAYDPQTLGLVRTLHYEGEGWGLTTDGTHLILSDGTETLRWMDRRNFRELHRLAVTEQGQPSTGLNELEYIGGEIWANVQGTEKIVRISPTTGRVQSWVDCHGLLADSRREAETMNGIAFDSGLGRIFLTGKLWPYIFQIRLVQS